MNSIITEATDAKAVKDLQPPGRHGLTFIAHGVHRNGGMERAAHEVLERVAQHREVAVIARRCDSLSLRSSEINCIERPAALGSLAFRRAARKRSRAFGNSITMSIGGAAGGVHIIVAQFCHAAFTQRYGGIRGGAGLRKQWQRFAQGFFTREEKLAYQSPTLRRVIAVSAGVGREVSSRYGVDPSRITCIPNGVDPEVFFPAPANEKGKLRAALGLPADGMLAAFVGGDWHRKGLHDVVAALPQAEQVRLLVVGKGDIAEWTSVASTLRVADRVHFVGVSNTPAAYLRAADFYAFPSRYEAFSLSCIEAAACGLPLLVTRINGVEDFVVHGENGFFVTPDSESVADAMIRLSEDQSLLRRMSQAAADSTADLTWDVIADRYEEVIQEVSDELKL